MKRKPTLSDTVFKILDFPAYVLRGVVLRLKRNAYAIAFLLAVFTALCTGYGLLLNHHPDWEAAKRFAWHTTAPETQGDQGTAGGGKATAEGTATSSADNGWFDECTDIIYEVAQVFVLNMAAYHDAGQSNLFLALGRLSTVLLFALLGLQAISMLFKESWYRFSQYFNWNTHVVFGLGRIGWHLVTQLTSEGKRVLCVEQNASSLWIEQARRLGAYAQCADARSGDVIESIPFHRTSKLYVVTGSDETNLQVAIDLTIQASRIRVWRWFRPIECYVHITDPLLESHLQNVREIHHGQVPKSWLKRVFSRLRDRVSRPVRIELYAFNILHDTAKHLIVNQLVPIRPGQDVTEDESGVLKVSEEVALYVLFGFGDMSQSLVIHLAQLAHFENLKRPRILVLTEDAENHAHRFHARWPGIGPKIVNARGAPIRFDSANDTWDTNHPNCLVSDARAIGHAANLQFAEFDGFAGNGALVEQIEALCKKRGVCPAIIFCVDDDDENFSQSASFVGSWRANARLKLPPVFAYFPRSKSMQPVLSAYQSISEEIHAFGNCADVVTLENIECPLTEELAIEIAHDYDRRHAAIDKPVKSTLTFKKTEGPGGQQVLRGDYDQSVFRQATEKFYESQNAGRHSNRMAADHSLVKLASLGYTVITPEAVSSVFTITEIKHISAARRMLTSQMEHNRYVAERLLAGWRFVAPEAYFGGKLIDGLTYPASRPHLCSWSTLLAMPGSLSKLVYGKADVDQAVADAVLKRAKTELAKDISKDFEQIHCIWNQLQARGYRIVLLGKEDVPV